MNEMLLYQQLLSGSLGPRGWFEVSLLAWLFAVLIFKPERIVKLASFKRAYVFLALSIMVPGIATLLASSVGTSSGSAMRSGELSAMFSFISASAQVCLGLSVLFGFASLVPKFILPPGAHSTPDNQRSGAEPPWLRDLEKQRDNRGPDDKSLEPETS